MKTENREIKTKKKPKEIYKDPIYGIPHFHDPAISRVMTKHDPLYPVQKSIKQILVKSQQRLTAAKSKKPKYLHVSYSIDTLHQSPLMCFPHFVEMTQFLNNWFDIRDVRMKTVITSTQRATFAAQNKFCDTLFLLLQETVRASPLTPKPLTGIYNWFLQRDNVIHQSRSIAQNSGDSQYIVIELMNGGELKIERRLLDVDQMLHQSIFSTDSAWELLSKPKTDTLENDRNTESQQNVHRPRILTDPCMPQVSKRQHESVLINETFNYKQLHDEMDRRRREEKETELMATAARLKRREEIKIQPCWQ